MNINGQFTGFWNGLIDEVEVFNRALSDSEIQAIYSAGSAGKAKRARHPWTGGPRKVMPTISRRVTTELCKTARPSRRASGAGL